MYAKSIIEHMRGRLAVGAWTQHLSIVPVVMALAVASLPFTLEQRADLTSVAGTPDDAVAESLTVPSADTNLVKTAANARLNIQEDRRQLIMAEYMARRFYVSKQVVLDLVKTAHAVGRKYNVDPTLLVAVMAVESSFNPIAESVAGAKGLMQIIPHFHLEKFVEFGGEQAVFDPRANIAVGAKIIREYLQAASGDLFKALQTYAGALPDHDASYTHKVLNEKDRLDAIMGVPKTDRGGRLSQSPAVQPAQGGRVQITLPPPAANPQPAPQQPDAAVKPAEPLAMLPLNIAAVRRAE